MKTSFIAVCAVTGILMAQTPSKVGSDADKSIAESSEELNIRAYIELLRTDVKSSKATIMGEVMQLDTDQANKFWPIFKAFEAEYSLLGDKVVSVVRNYADNYDKITNDVADQLAGQVLTIEQQRNGLKKKYYERVKQSLGAVTAMRFLQVENQLERVVDLQIAAQLPVVRETKE